MPTRCVRRRNTTASGFCAPTPPFRCARWRCDTRNSALVEQAFRTAKSLLDTRPIFHKCDETIRGHVFCSFLALLMQKELFLRMAKAGIEAEWADIPARSRRADRGRDRKRRQAASSVRSRAKGATVAILRCVGARLPCGSPAGSPDPDRLQTHLLLQPARQPEPLIARLVAAQHPHGASKRPFGLRPLPLDQDAHLLHVRSRQRVQPNTLARRALDAERPNSC